MRHLLRRPARLLLLASLAAAAACGGRAARPAASTAPPPPPAAPLAADDEMVESTIRFLEDRVRQDPLDFIAYNKLCGYYLQRQRETGDVQYLELAARAARASLKAIPAEQNAGGLAALARTEFATHDFASARDHAQQLTKLEPRKSYPYELLGDALLELGDYDGADAAFAQLERASGAQSLSASLRRARVYLLRGQTDEARARYQVALALALDPVPPDRETVAWCRWQLGEVAFGVGNYDEAERQYTDALTTFPDYYRALAGLGRVRAARGDLPGAIARYEQVTKRLPDPVYVAALGDLYTLAGRGRDAQAQYALVEQIARLGALNGQLYNRQLALFYADHDLKPAEAYELAAREYEQRRDIYGADALAWAALKAGKLAEARRAVGDALKLGTRDARLFYHAGLVARAAGDRAAAADYLKRALALNPQFDPLQARVAQRALAE
ncbi:MAG TPA: tetratricopeptide repeat protein [Pyrinomonadaceae bacterium]|jgi:tetratricopeptide (TPR) repeat protein